MVLFGEAMAEPDWGAACEAARQCELMITVGTSGTVMPAAGLPLEARGAGAPIGSVDPETPGLHDIWLRGPAAAILPALLEAAFGGQTPGAPDGE